MIRSIFRALPFALAAGVLVLPVAAQAQGPASTPGARNPGVRVTIERRSYLNAGPYVVPRTARDYALDPAYSLGGASGMGLPYPPGWVDRPLPPLIGGGPF